MGTKEDQNQIQDKIERLDALITYLETNDIDEENLTKVEKIIYES